MRPSTSGMQMPAFRDLGDQYDRGLSHAALPLGPQLNNYRDLVEEIKKADASQVEPLTRKEFLIINKIVRTFPDKCKVYDAAHREKAWQDKPVGAAIPYSEGKGIK